MENQFDNEFIKAHINTIILSTLIPGEKYGYEIAKDIKEKTNNQFELKQPTMYAGLKRLETNGFIRSSWRDSDIGGKRHYYSLTEKGVQELDKNKEIWSKSLGVVSTFFGTSVMSSEAKKQNDEITEEINNLKSEIYKTNQSNFLDELEDRNIDYNENLERFKDAMYKLKYAGTRENNAVDNAINYVSDSALIIDEKPQIIDNTPLSLFDLVETANISVEKKEVESDGYFLEPSPVQDFNNEKTSFDLSISKQEIQKKEEPLNDGAFISSAFPVNSQLDPTEIEKRQIENSFKSEDFNLEINYVSSPLNFDSVAKKAILDEKQFEKNILDKRYAISNSTKWSNIKIPTKYYNKNKVKLASLLLTIPFLIFGFLTSFLVAYFTETTSNNLLKSYLICGALFMFVLIYFAFIYFTCPNKKAIYKKNYNVLYAFIFVVITISAIIAIYNFKFDVALFNNTYTYLWLNPSILILGIFIYSILKNSILTIKLSKKY